VKTATGRCVGAAHHQAAGSQLSYSKVFSPISGEISDRPLYAGGWPALALRFSTVMTSRGWSRAPMLRRPQAVSVKVGQFGHITIVDGGAWWQGKVTVVSPATDPGSTTSGVGAVTTPAAN